MPDVFDIFGHANVAVGNTAEQVYRGRSLRRECAVGKLDGGSAINAPRAGKSGLLKESAVKACPYSRPTTQRPSLSSFTYSALHLLVMTVATCSHQRFGLQVYSLEY